MGEAPILKQISKSCIWIRYPTTAINSDSSNWHWHHKELHIKRTQSSKTCSNNTQFSLCLFTGKHPLPPICTAKQFVILPLLHQSNSLVTAQVKAVLATRNLLSGVYSTHSRTTICTSPVRSALKSPLRKDSGIAKNQIVQQFKELSKPFGIVLWLLHLCFLVSKVNCYYNFHSHQHLTLNLCISVCGGYSCFRFVNKMQHLIFKHESTEQFSLFSALPLRMQW